MSYTIECRKPHGKFEVNLSTSSEKIAFFHFNDCKLKGYIYRIRKDGKTLNRKSFA